MLRDVRRQQGREWGVHGAVAQAGYRTVDTLVLGVLGMGDIGRRVAEVGAAFGMTVWACTRRGGGGGGDGSRDGEATASFVSRTFGTGDEELRAFLGGCDYLVNLLPSTAETRGLLSASRLSWCKRLEQSAHGEEDGGEGRGEGGGGGGGGDDPAVTVLINVGRGDVFGDGGEDDVIAALDAGHLRWGP
jgi:phosphoglycerate dehydrogenase-like enzyme